MPPAVGSGCRQRIEATRLASGVATSPIKFRPSAVFIEIDLRLAGNTVLGRINSDTK